MKQDKKFENASRLLYDIKEKLWSMQKIGEEDTIIKDINNFFIRNSELDKVDSDILKVDSEKLQIILEFLENKKSEAIDKKNESGDSEMEDKLDISFLELQNLFCKLKVRTSFSEYGNISNRNISSSTTSSKTVISTPSIYTTTRRSEMSGINYHKYWWVNVWRAITKTEKILYTPIKKKIRLND